WRPHEIVLATGARTIFDYDDANMKVTQTTRPALNEPIALPVTKYLNGLGLVRREDALAATGQIDIVETEYDRFGRMLKQTRPYRGNDVKQWQNFEYDAAGRVKTIIEPPMI